jgi:putative transposase
MEPLRTLTLIDEYTRECLTLKVARRLRSKYILGQLGYLFIYRGLPGFISSENGKLKSETHSKYGEKEGLKSFWFESGEKKNGDT